MSEIICAACGEPILSGNSEDWHIKLCNAQSPTRDGAVTDMIIRPLLDRDLHFHDMSCLADYVSAIKPRKGGKD